MKKRLIIGLIILFCIADIFLLIKSRKHLQINFQQNSDTAAQKFFSINGKTVSQTEAQNRPIAVMVENYPDARPQSGLIDADMVFEAPTEGGITRFLAIYQAGDSKNIGPVRSARTYFADFANELGAVYAHVGGNSDVLANIRSGQYQNISDADQFFNDPYFQRVSFRPMPHNVYTSTEKLRKLIMSHNYSGIANFNLFLFKDDAPSASTTAADVGINFSTKNYEVEWKYDFSDNSYFRFLAGSAHNDSAGQQIKAKNIIVQFVKTFSVKTDTPLSIGMDLNSGGKAEIFLDGQVEAGLWKKQDGRTRYYNEQGQEISLNRGQIWVELVPEGQVVTWQ